MAPHTRPSNPLSFSHFCFLFLFRISSSPTTHPTNKQTKFKLNTRFLFFIINALSTRLSDAHQHRYLLSLCLFLISCWICLHK